MCQSVEDIVLHRKVVMAAQYRYWSVWVGFLYIEVNSVLLGPEGNQVSKIRENLRYTHEHTSTAYGDFAL